METLASSGRGEPWPSSASRDEVRMVSISGARPNDAGVFEESGIPRSQLPRGSWARAWLNPDTPGHNALDAPLQLCGCPEGWGPKRGISAQNGTRLWRRVSEGMHCEASGAIPEAPRGTGDGCA